MSLPLWHKFRKCTILHILLPILSERLKLLYADYNITDGRNMVIILYKNIHNLQKVCIYCT